MSREDTYISVQGSVLYLVVQNTSSEIIYNLASVEMYT